MSRFHVGFEIELPLALTLLIIDLFSIIIQDVIKSILGHTNQNIDDIVEITLEANPGDLDNDKLNEFIDCGINRISLGIQVRIYILISIIFCG